ncbi:MAG: 30S ribosome-binding factor RbfA [Candidatus Omnitrophota bacterium]
MTTRPEKVQEALRQELSRIIHGELKDPRLGFLTITSVELTKDLRYAKVYFSVLGDIKNKKLALKGLNNAKGYIRNLVADRIKLRFVPELSFRIDDSFEKTREILDLLDRVKKETAHEKGDRSDKEA